MGEGLNWSENPDLDLLCVIGFPSKYSPSLMSHYGMKDKQTSNVHFVRLPPGVTRKEKPMSLVFKIVIKKRDRVAFYVPALSNVWLIESLRS